MTAEETASCSETCTAEAHKIFDFGSGYVSLSLLKEMMIRAGMDTRIVDQALVNGLCDLPGCEGKFHCHCGDKMGLLCRAKTALIYKAVISELNRGRDTHLGGVALSYYGYDYCRCYALGNTMWLKCERDAMKILGFLGSIGVFHAQYKLRDAKTLIEMRFKGFNGANEICKCLKEYAEFELMGDGGEIDVLGSKLYYGTIIKLFPRFVGKDSNKNKSARYRVSRAVLLERFAFGLVHNVVDHQGGRACLYGIVRADEAGGQALLLLTFPVRRPALPLRFPPELAVHEQGSGSAGGLTFAADAHRG